MNRVDILFACPVFRVFDQTLSQQFYLDYLGFTNDWEHKPHPNAPLYMQVSRGQLKIHLSEHFGDASPAATAFVPMHGITEFHKELVSKANPNCNPKIEKVSWGKSMQLTDPFGNRLRFTEQAHH